MLLHGLTEKRTDRQASFPQHSMKDFRGLFRVLLIFELWTILSITLYGKTQ